MPEYGPNETTSGGAYMMNRTRLFYQDQYMTADILPSTTTVDISSSSRGSGSVSTSNSTLLHYPRGSSTERRTSVGSGCATYAADSPRR